MSFLLLACMILGDLHPFEKGDPLEQVPDDHHFLLQNPCSFALDGLGHFYLLDFSAKTIFKWDQRGTFIGNIGQPGNGPGEFTFMGANGTGFLSLINDRLYVYDGWKSGVQVFERDGTFLEFITLTTNRTRVFDFAVSKENKFIVLLRHANSDGRYLSVGSFDHKGKQLNVFSRKRDTSSIVRIQGKQKQVTLNAFHPTLVTYFNGNNNEILIGDSEKSSFQVLDMNGHSRTLSTSLQRFPVTSKDMDEVQQLFKKRSPVRSIEYPEYKPYYTHLRVLGQVGFLVYLQSPYLGDIKGIYMNEQGRLEGQFRFSCGVGGGLLGSGNRILGVFVTEDGEFVLNEILSPKRN